MDQKLTKEAVAATLRACIWQMLSLNLGWDIGYNEVFFVIFLSFPGKMMGWYLIYSMITSSSSPFILLLDTA
jgi:hypothetical protein